MQDNFTDSKKRKMRVRRKKEQRRTRNWKQMELEALPLIRKRGGRPWKKKREGKRGELNRMETSEKTDTRRKKKN